MCICPSRDPAPATTFAPHSGQSTSASHNTFTPLFLGCSMSQQTRLQTAGDLANFIKASRGRNPAPETAAPAYPTPGNTAAIPLTLRYAELWGGTFLDLATRHDAPNRALQKQTQGLGDDKQAPTDSSEYYVSRAAPVVGRMQHPAPHPTLFLPLHTPVSCPPHSHGDAQPEGHNPKQAQGEDAAARQRRCPDLQPRLCLALPD